MTLPDNVPFRDPAGPRPIDLPTPVPLSTGGDLSALDEAKIFAAPADPAQRPAWRAALRRWRTEAATRIGYDGSLYERAEYRWAAGCPVVCLAWLWDETLYDTAGNIFTPDAFLDHGIAEFGGYDAVVLWHAYPLIGLDERNQFDYYRHVPGLKDLVAAFHRRGVRVFLDYNPWDTGTRPEPGTPLEAMAEAVRGYGADGVFLDTMKEGADELRTLLPAGTVLEGESRVPLARVHDHHMSWAQWFADSDVPGVLRARWFERRHMLHHTRRWNRDHSAELQSGWINGAGILVWENVFGTNVAWNPRDRALLRAVRPLLARFADVLTEGEWTPLGDSAESGPVHAGRFDHAGTTFWPLVNRSDQAHTGTLLTARPDGRRWFDAMTGRPLTPADWTVDGLRGTVAARSLGAVVALPEDADTAFLADRPALTDDTAFPFRPTVRIAAPAVAPAAAPPAGTARLAGGAYTLAIEYRQRETGLYEGAPYVEDWKPLPPRLHSVLRDRREVVLADLAIQTREVTVREYRRFLAGSGYRPAVHDRFLAETGPDDAPVTCVDLDDARAYAAWAGMRLPTEDEWQAAAEAGLLDRLEPLVWNWTESEHTDGRTRFSMLKGGSAYRAQGSEWYLDGGPQPPHVTVKLLRAGPAIARSTRVGFRCAVTL